MFSFKEWRETVQIKKSNTTDSELTFVDLLLSVKLSLVEDGSASGNETSTCKHKKINADYFWTTLEGKSNY